MTAIQRIRPPAPDEPKPLSSKNDPRVERLAEYVMKVYRSYLKDPGKYKAYGSQAFRTSPRGKGTMTTFKNIVIYLSTLRNQNNGSIPMEMLIDDYLKVVMAWYRDKRRVTAVPQQVSPGPWISRMFENWVAESNEPNMRFDGTYWHRKPLPPPPPVDEQIADGIEWRRKVIPMLIEEMPPLKDEKEMIRYLKDWSTVPINSVDEFIQKGRTNNILYPYR